MGGEGEEGGRGLKSMRDVCKGARLCVVCYMSTSKYRWIQEA